MYEQLDSPALRTCGVTVMLCDVAAAVGAVEAKLSAGSGTPLAVGSVNLDHLHHFPDGVPGASARWLWLADGMPIVRRAASLGAGRFPRVTGADLLPELLTLAELRGLRVGFVGGWPDMHQRLKDTLQQRFPELIVAGTWAPERRELYDAALPRAIADADVDMLVVGLGKPRQEQWIGQFAELTGASVLLAFGAAADFIAGDVRRAPTAMQHIGMEWAYRLVQEPRRLARRYLLDGPPALLRLREATLVRPDPDHQLLSS